MFEVLPVNEAGIIAFKTSGKLTRADYETFLPRLEELIRKYGTISLYIELEGFQGWEADAAWADLRFDFQHDKDFKRIAIVGDTALEHWGVVLSNFFTRSSMRFFSKPDAQAAWDWLEEHPADEDTLRRVEPYSNILLAADFSRYSERAAHKARELCEQYGAHLHVLHIVEQMVLYNDNTDRILADIPSADETLIVQAEDSLRKFAKRTKLGKDVDLKVQWGTPKRSIVSWAREKNVDLIVVGSHGQHGIERLLGSVSNSVLNQAHCDVLVVKP
ncbi:hypothetical protein MNBD_GAMMA15-2029 [hydrothermal vent metagenome]|uniref:UspA domain-containing protein n=1 Tax=hydrothermal vent metagenome TaxID=652676 RepID=A0A3B0Z1K7_9ZZZZ